MDRFQSFVCIGAGNVAYHLCGALVTAGYKPLQVISKNPAHAGELADLLNAGSAGSPDQVRTDADFYVIAVNDDAITAVLKDLPVRKQLVFHTSASTGMNVFGKKFDRYGVLYPLQTFSRTRPLDFGHVPVFVSSPDAKTRQDLRKIAADISGIVQESDPQTLLQIHIAAVFACNFTNHMFVIAEALLKDTGIPFELLKPLIQETFLKLGSGTPALLQTGPAARGDVKILEKHLKALEKHPDYQKIYTFVSQNIRENQHKNSLNE